MINEAGEQPRLFLLKINLKKMYTHVHKERDFSRGIKGIKRLALKLQESPENIALNMVEENKPLVKKYVIEHGQKPYEHPAMLAAQVTMIHEGKIAQKQADGVPDYFEAEKAVWAEDQNAEDSGNVSQFGGGLFAGIITAGNKALDKINAKRRVAGKKEILGGEKGLQLRAKLQRHADLEPYINPNPNSGGIGAGILSGQSDASIFLNAGIDEVRRQETMRAIKQYAPIGIAVIIAVFLIGKSMK